MLGRSASGFPLLAVLLVTAEGCFFSSGFSAAAGADGSSDQDGGQGDGGEPRLDSGAIDSGSDGGAGPSTDSGWPSDAGAWPDSGAPSDSGAIADSGASSDAGPPLNIVRTSNGGVLESFTSEYCNPASLPSNCEAGYWNHTNINDGEHAHGNSATAFRASWASAFKGGSTTPEEFVFSFAGGAVGRISSVVIQNYGEEGGFGPYYSTHFVLSGEPPAGGGWFVILDEDIVDDETPQTFDVVAITGSAAVVRRVRLSLTDSVASDYWELGEFEAWGHLD